MTHRASPLTLLAMSALLALSSLACLSPALLDPDYEDGEQDNNVTIGNNRQNNVTIGNNRQNNIDRPSTRQPIDEGSFEVELTGALVGRLDATGRGEATLNLTKGAPGFFAAHCQIALVDQDQGAESQLGLVVLRVYGDSCRLRPGAYPLRQDASVTEDEKAGGGVLTVQRVEFEQGVEEPKIYELDALSGELVVEESSDAMLRASFSLTSNAFIEDESRRRDGATTVTGRFMAEEAAK